MNTRPLQPGAAPAPDRLALIESARRAVLGEGGLQAAPWVEPWIDRSWRRCLAQGLRPQQAIAFQAVSGPATHRAIEASRPLLHAAAPVIQSLARAMADTRYFAILTDAQGVVIDVNGPVDRHNPHADLIARVGVDLSENAVGTTAIGATLAELQPVWLHRGEHFFDDNGVYSCAGAPLFGPDGRCVGMLDLTGIHVAERPALKHLVAQSARSIENALTLAQPHQLLLRIHWPGSSPEEDSAGLVCVDADGFIKGTNRAAADMLTLTPGTPWPHCSDVFAVPFETLFDTARSEHAARELPLWSGLRLAVSARLNTERARAQSTRPAMRPTAPLKEVETALIRKAVEDARGNVMEAARVLGISRATVYRKLTRKKPTR
ncbi:MAG: helix-turn-helix domain-containing protein [Hydrogenophaga sp.]|uniref:helix-turn-helix domain-containing protein n=1 Tax=Hydrogenophaga sp. TaxID=1904254 RepID=UPI002728ADEA|nr:helix-turn-helix domain-containing protein [Hydrogenophaga sp.]MDO9571347.1 helix-turn-helix domain-containing protein [Hydrogenophaga sp.]MDP2096186.1 helix-turn-helix domain-containing protein [Hydrogenophaga sp.]MDP2222009.1 helix-turn-helix domain-containing protein [Hydrogenophaga sp.]MDP3376277.1 helix-turn-helix domain-containing protein [Hydrogenophaga sp.]